MKIKEFNKLMKNDNPKHILFLHMIDKIFLTDKQLDVVLKNRRRTDERRDI